MEPPKILTSPVASEHAAEILKLENAELRRIYGIYTDAREKIAGRLATAKTGTFTEQHLLATKAQIDAGLAVMIDELHGAAQAHTARVMRIGVEQMLEQIAYWEPKFRGGATGAIQTQAMRKVTKPGNLLLANYEASLNAYGSNLIEETGRRLGMHLVMRSNWSEMADDIAGQLEHSMIQGAHWKAERIVRTENIDALAAGHQAALEVSAEHVPGLKKQWDSTLDERTSEVCSYPNGLHGKVVGINESWTYRGDKIARPPAIPNCRSRVLAWHADWDAEDAEEEQTRRSRPRRKYIPTKAERRARAAAAKAAERRAAQETPERTR